MKFAGWQKSSLIDFPGRVAAVLFLAGCNYDCYFCHNRALIDGAPGAQGWPDVKAFLERRRGLLDGVVLTGGEPTLHGGLPLLIEEIARMGFEVKLDTNGSRPEMVRDVLLRGGCSYFAVDYKAPAREYRRICGAGADPALPLSTIDMLLRSGAGFEVRTTLIPQIGERELREMAGELPQLPLYRINRYRRPELYRERDAGLVDESAGLPWDPDALRRVVSPYQPNVTV